jgi:hypothetical protein
MNLNNGALNGTEWHENTAMYYALSLERLATQLGRTVLRSVHLTRLLSALFLALERSIPVRNCVRVGDAVSPSFRSCFYARLCGTVQCAQQRSCAHLCCTLVLDRCSSW